MRLVVARKEGGEGEAAGKESGRRRKVGEGKRRGERREDGRGGQGRAEEGVSGLNRLVLAPSADVLAPQEDSCHLRASSSTPPLPHKLRLLFFPAGLQLEEEREGLTRGGGDLRAFEREREESEGIRRGEGGDKESEESEGIRRGRKRGRTEVGSSAPARRQVLLRPARVGGDLVVDAGRGGEDNPAEEARISNSALALPLFLAPAEHMQTGERISRRRGGGGGAVRSGTGEEEEEEQ
eukprot:754765-Hanusia_phi.AAC.2